MISHAHDSIGHAVRALSLALAMLGFGKHAFAQAITPAFQYQGELRLNSGPANGSFDLRFSLHNAVSGGTQLGSTLSLSGVTVVDGLFSVPLNFGASQFAGDRQWLEVQISPAGAGGFVTLAPRTEVMATPYAWAASTALANSVTGISIVDGTIGTAEINATQIQQRVSGTCGFGQYMQSVAQNGTVSCGIDATGSGTVTSVTTGAGLTGGPITSTGTLSIATGGVTSAMLLDGSVSSSDVNSSQVQRRVVGSCSGANFFQQVNQDGTVVCGAAPGASGGWSLSGNSGTDPANNFMGTTDAQALVLRTANVRSLRIEPSALTFGNPALPVTNNMIAGSHANELTVGVRGATIAGGGLPVGFSDPEVTGASPNAVSDHYGSVSGGMGNRAGNSSGTVADRMFASVGGGNRNTASGFSSRVGGGQLNQASGSSSAIGGGTDNLASGSAATVGGGDGNTASGAVSTVSGGISNTSSGLRSMVGGGSNNVAQGDRSTIMGGDGNTAIGTESTVSGGIFNCAGGANSWAGGKQAKVRPASNPLSGSCSALPSYPGGSGDNGTFVWADSQNNSNFVSTGPNQFLVRAQGGMAINSNDPLGNDLRVNGTLRVDNLGTAGATSLCRNGSNQIASCSSSARYKTDIVDLQLGLQTALGMRAVAYRWKDSGLADIGFVAEEIAQIDERLVTRGASGEIEGVKYDRLTAMLTNAVQELAAQADVNADELRRVETSNRTLTQALEQHIALNAALQTRIERLEALLTPPVERHSKAFEDVQ